MNDKIDKLISAATKIVKSGYNPASYIKIPIENIELMSKEFNLTMEEAINVLAEYFKPQDK